MSADTTIIRKTKTLTTLIDDEVIVLDLDSQEYFGLEGAAKELWQCLDPGPMTMNVLLQRWSGVFDNSEQELRSLALAAMEQLQERDLVMVEHHAI